MSIYLLVYISSILFLYLGRKETKFGNFSIFVGLLLPILLAGFRGIDVGTDTENYKEIYDIIEYEGRYIPIVEPLYYIIAKIAIFFNKFSVVLLFYQTFTILLVYKFARKCNHSLNICFIFIIYYFLLYNASLNIMRQSAAIAYLLYISLYLRNKEIKKYVLFSFLGIMIHSTVIIGALLLYIIEYISLSKSIYRKLMIVGYLFSLVAIYLLVGILLQYLSSFGGGMLAGKAQAYSSSNSSISFTYLTMSFFMIVLWFLCDIF